MSMSTGSCQGSSRKAGKTQKRDDFKENNFRTFLICPDHSVMIRLFCKIKSNKVKCSARPVTKESPKVSVRRALIDGV